MSGAGALRDRITFRRAVQGRDEYGNVVDGDFEDIEVTPGTPLTVWADVRERLGGEKQRSGSVDSAHTATIRVRHSESISLISEADVILARAKTWNIRSIVPVEKDRGLIEFLCEAGVAI